MVRGLDSPSHSGAMIAFYDRNFVIKASSDSINDCYCHHIHRSPCTSSDGAMNKSLLHQCWLGRAQSLSLPFTRLVFWPGELSRRMNDDDKDNNDNDDDDDGSMEITMTTAMMIIMKKFSSQGRKVQSEAWRKRGYRDNSHFHTARWSCLYCKCFHRLVDD